MSSPSTQFSSARYVGNDPMRLFGELKRISVEQLGAVPGAMFAPMEAHLHDALRTETENGSGIGGIQRDDLMLLLVLRQRSAIHVMRYREQVGRVFDEFSGLAKTSAEEEPLGLVSDTELQFRMACERMADSVTRLYQLPLHLLQRRFDSLASALGMPPSVNPVGPMRLIEHFMTSFRDADLSESLQQLLVDQYEQQLVKILGDFYAKLNAELAAGGFECGRHAMAGSDRAHAHSGSSHAHGSYESEVNTGMFFGQPPPATPVSTPGAHTHGHNSPYTHAAYIPHPGQEQGRPSQDSDLFQVSPQARSKHQKLRDMLHAWRNSGDATDADTNATAPPTAAGWGGAANDSGRRELRVDELASVVSLLQREIYEPFEQAITRKCPLNEAIREHLQDGARRLGLDPEQTCVAQQDADAIDLVGFLFEAMLSGHALTGDARHLFARLVMTYVHIALTDDSLFVRPGHPAKRLLDALALSFESNDGASPQDRELMDCAEQAVERVVAEYNENLAILDLAANELQALLQQQRRRAEVVERRSAETVHGRERLLQARLQATSALAQRMSGRALTSTIGRFLERYWQHHYVQTLLRCGHDSMPASKALAIADALIALDAAAAGQGGGDVANRLLAMRDALEKCLASSGLDASASNEWIAGLARAVAFPDTAREERSVQMSPRLTDDSDDTRLLRVVGGNATLDFDPSMSERMRQLRPGDWMRLVDESGIEGSAKVAWISPLTSRLLLVNRRGMRKLVASPEQLAALVKTGRLLADADELPFDQAMQDVRQRLAKSAARAA